MILERARLIKQHTSQLLPNKMSCCDFNKTTVSYGSEFLMIWGDTYVGVSILILILRGTTHHLWWLKMSLVCCEHTSAYVNELSIALDLLAYWIFEHIGQVVRMLVSEYRCWQFKPWHQYAVSLSKTLYLHCTSRLSCEMITRCGQPHKQPRVQCYELFGWIALKNHAFSFPFLSIILSYF